MVNSHGEYTKYRFTKIHPRGRCISSSAVQGVTTTVARRFQVESNFKAISPQATVEGVLKPREPTGDHPWEPRIFWCMYPWMGRNDQHMFQPVG